jgi:hypothetical protein
MNKCANCDAVATSVYSITNNLYVLYCEKDIPSSLRGSGSVTTLTTDETLAAEFQQVATVSAKNTKTTTIDKSDVVEEDVELNSIENDTTEEVDNESESGLS